MRKKNNTIEYKDIVSKSESSRNWFYIITQILPSLNKNELIRSICSELHMWSVSQGGNLDLHKFPHIQHITWEDIGLPVLSFNRIDDYQKFMRTLWYQRVPQGVSIPVDLNSLLKRMWVSNYPTPTRPIHILVYCMSQLPWGAMPSDQILTHETVHGIDPLLEVRRESSDSLILTEMIATIREFASNDWDFFRLNTLPEFWSGYLRQVHTFSLDFFEVLKIPSNSLITDIANAITRFVYELTTRNNTEMVKLLMKCRTFKELLDELRILMPNQYRSRSQVATTTSSSVWENLEGDNYKKRLNISRYYYNNWPTSYVFGKRSISSLWQQEFFGDQAMNVFLGQGNEELKFWIAFLRFFSFQFDIYNITSFKVERKKEWNNFRITISW